MIKYPSYEEVHDQLVKEFANYPVEISTDEISNLSQVVSSYFTEMMDKAYEGFAIHSQETPFISVCRWKTEEIRSERMYYSMDYSSVSIRSLDYAHLTIHVVVAWGVKRVELHFVAPMTDGEKTDLSDRIDDVMKRLNIGAENSGDIKKMIMARACQS